jgi:mannitol operon repressor
MWLAINPNTQDAITELQNGSDRTLGVVVAAIVDSALVDIVKRDLKSKHDTPYSQQVQNELFQSDGPLGSLGTKMRLTHLLGYLTETAHDDLQNLRRIRNLFAHYSEHNSFDTQKIRDRCANFKMIDSNILHSDIVHDGKLVDGVFFDAHKGVCLRLVEREEALKTAKGRFISIAKLFLAGFELHRQNSLLTKPIF